MPKKKSASARAKGARQKGARLELEVAKMLSTWSGLDIKRTPLSGGWAKGSPGVAGDVVSVTPGQDLPFSVEVKNNESWHWEQIINGKGRGLVPTWWKQAEDDCPTGKFPILVFSKRHHDLYVMYRTRNMPELWVGGDGMILFVNGFDVSRFSDFLINFPLAFLETTV